MDVLKSCLILALALTAESRSLTDEGVVGSETSDSNSAPVVRIKTQGLVRGRRALDGAYYQYMGIPYANSSQEYRFQYPLPVPTWDGIREADVVELHCLHIDKPTRKMLGQEDCLILNVYTPDVDKTDLKAVMVYFHGGGYNKESSARSLYGPRWFMEENVILITFNYRLGLLGCMCTGEIANNDLKDAITVLKWIKANIEAFGGDPNRVTIFGQSVGSAMVDMLVLSKAASGLFRGAIAQSMSVTSAVAMTKNHEKNLRFIAEQLGYDGPDGKARILFLKNSTAEDIVRVTESASLKAPYEFLALTPCVESSSNPGAVLTASPMDIVNSRQYNDVPYIVGFSKDEATSLYSHINVSDFIDMLNQDFLNTLPEDLRQLNRSSEIINLAKTFYFGGDNITVESMTNVIKYISDVWYVQIAIKYVQGFLRSGKKSPMYMYEITYDGGNAFAKKRMSIARAGVCHGDELGYLFTQYAHPLVGEDDKLFSKIIVTLWTNFAKYNDPTPQTSSLLPVKWTAVTDKLDYLELNPVMKPMAQKPFPERVDFWDNVYRNFTTA